jgi:dCMP deaminase
MDSINWHQRFLDLAEHISSWSKDPSTQVGAVIVDDQRRIVSTGYNGFPRGVEDLDSRLQDRTIKYEMIVHGEINAILFANQSIYGCTLYTWPFMPCSRCAAIVIQSGIRTVVAPYNDNPRWQTSFQLTEQMFREAGVRLHVIGTPDVR